MSIIISFCVCQSAVQRVAAENGGVVGHPRIRHSTVPNGGWGGTRHLVVRRRTCSAHPSVAFAARPVAFLSRPTRRVEGTRDGGGDGGCRVVRAGWSSYPTGVLRVSTYPSGHVALVVVRRSSDVVRFFCLAADRRFKFTIH